MGELLLLLIPAAVWFVPFFAGIRYLVWSAPDSGQRIVRGVVLGIIHTVMAVGTVYYMVNRALHADELSGLLFIPPILAVIGAAVAINLVLLLSLTGRMQMWEA